jgi:hypothetical protein
MMSEIQRYDGWEMEDNDEDGDYVLYAVHQAALAERDKQITELEALLKQKDITITSINTLSQHQYDVQDDLDKQIAALTRRLSG